MNHDIYMRRCLELAQTGMREAMPNPSVGAVLVHDGRIIGEGSTSAYGGPHGEVNCLGSVADKDRHLIPHATLYVSLEPCSHYGKTPPCCDLIIRHGIKHIVIGTADPHLKVAGNGLKTLQEAGSNVITGVLEEECREMNRRFFTFHEKKRPYVILKWAQSADGYLSPEPFPALGGAGIASKKPVWITNKYSRQLVHKWRSEEMAILAGTKTVLDDNPALDVRDWTGPDPVRVVLDRHGKITDEYIVKNLKIKTIILTEKENCTNLENLIFENVAFNGQLPQAVMEVLYHHNLLSVIIEGGRQTLQTFIDANLWDEARVFKGQALFKAGTAAPVLSGKVIQKQAIGQDGLTLFRNHGQHDNI